MPADVTSELVARKVMSSSIIMVRLIQTATEEAITIRLHSQNVASTGEVWLPEIVGMLRVCNGRLLTGNNYITDNGSINIGRGLMLHGISFRNLGVI